GMYLASADADGVVKVWDLRMVAEVLQIDTGNMPANEADWDISGTVIAVASMDSSVKLFDVWEKKFLRTLEGHEDSAGSAVRGILTWECCCGDSGSVGVT
ncbi:WD repeat pf20, putative, partial [Perkinsus marinus ATCC 50983]